jgi:hypothetical protein
VKNFGYYMLCALGIVLGLAILLPCGFGVYKTGMWTWTNVEMLSGGGHPLNATLAIVVGIIGLVAVLVTASGSLGGLALIIAGLVALNQEPWSRSAIAVSAMKGAEEETDESAGLS